MNSQVEQGIADWLAATLPGETVRAGVENANLANAKYVVCILPDQEHVIGEYFKAEARLTMFSPIAGGDKAVHKALEDAVYEAVRDADAATIGGYVSTATGAEYTVNGKFVRGWERTSDGARWETTLLVLFGVGPAA